MDSSPKYNDLGFEQGLLVNILSVSEKLPLTRVHLTKEHT